VKVDIGAVKADIPNRIFGMILGTLVVNIIAVVGAMFAVAKLAGHLEPGAVRPSQPNARRRLPDPVDSAPSQFVVIRLFGRFKFVNPLKNLVDPRRNEFAI
jgi:hypothetical protein